MRHAMLRVASVEDAVGFWRARGARVINPTPPAAAGRKPSSTFVGFGIDDKDPLYFAFEIIAAKPDETVVNTAVDFIGVTMRVRSHWHT